MFLKFQSDIRGNCWKRVSHSGSQIPWIGFKGHTYLWSHFMAAQSFSLRKYCMGIRRNQLKYAGCEVPRKFNLRPKWSGISAKGHDTSRQVDYLIQLDTVEVHYKSFTTVPDRTWYCNACWQSKSSWYKLDGFSSSGISMSIICSSCLGWRNSSTLVVRSFSIST